MLDEQPKLNYKRLVTLVLVASLSTLGLYKLSCQKSEKFEEVPYCTLVDKVVQELPNNAKFSNLLAQKSLDVLTEKNIKLETDTYIKMFNIIKSKMQENPELSNHLPKNVINYQLNKNKLDIKEYIFGRSK